MLWRRIYSLPAGTPMFVGGSLELENGQGRVPRPGRASRWLVVIYDGPRETILPRAIGGGRQKNEYWNRFTLPALITGSFFLVVIAFLLLRFPPLRLPAILALTLSTFPLAPLLPPGVALYFLYRGLWKRARLLRAERDLLVLPLRYFPEEERTGGERTAPVLPTGGRRSPMTSHGGRRTRNWRTVAGHPGRGAGAPPAAGRVHPLRRAAAGPGAADPRPARRPDGRADPGPGGAGGPLRAAATAGRAPWRSCSVLSVLGGVLVNLFLILYALTLLIR